MAEEEKFSTTFPSPTQRHGPLTDKTFVGINPDKSIRHVPIHDLVEPKVYSPYKTKPGHVPRPIEVERRKRKFAHIDITALLKGNGVIDSLMKEAKQSATVTASSKQPTGFSNVDMMPLFNFDNTDYHSRPTEQWHDYVLKSGSKGIPARAIYKLTVKGELVIEWRNCSVIDCNPMENTFTVLYHKIDKYRSGLVKLTDTNATGQETSIIEAIFVCFDAEDPELYCNRLLTAIKNRKETADKIALNLYVDCMPVDNLKPLDSEQVHRILENAINQEKIKQNSMLDTSALLQQYNLNHMRTINKLMFIKLLEDQQNDVKKVQAVSTDPSLLLDVETIFPKRISIETHTELPFIEYARAFRFASLWNKMEAINILYQLQIENYQIEKVLFFQTPEKTLRLEEFNMGQASALNNLITIVKETWLNGITTSVKSNLKDVKKGWFNIDEDNLEVYKFSKLKNFMYRINFIMEDTLRDLMYRMVAEYNKMIATFCPTNVKIHSNESVEIIGGKFPMLTIDLKFINATATTVAEFVYSTSVENLKAAIIAPFEAVFTNLKGMLKVERKVMKRLFWAYDPVVSIPHISEEWAANALQNLSETVDKALQPLTDYLATLIDFKDLIEIDITKYVADAEAKFFPNDTMNMNDLCELAQKHQNEAENVFHQLPSSISVGLVMIDCKIVKTLLSAKHKEIAAKLFQLLQSKSRDYANLIMEDFRSMYDSIAIPPRDIEKLTELRELMAGMPQRIDALAEKIIKNEVHFALMEDAKWKIPLDEMDIRWDVFRWPGKLGAEIIKQEKNHRVLEHQYRKSMEEEQSEFSNDLHNLHSDVARLKDLTKLGDAAKNAETVRHIRQTIAEADEKARLFNSREGLFNSQMTEYAQISELSKTFEPFYDLWDSAEKWLSNKEIWTEGPFMELDSDAVENSVNTLLKNLNKSTKAFERLGLPQCNTIAAQVRDEVDAFRPKVPLITSLRNPGMRDRHWADLTEKTGAAIPDNKSELTLQKLVDLGLVTAMGDVEKVAEKAGKEFAIEVALDKMAKAWESVTLLVEMYRDTGTGILKGVDEYMSLLDEHITMTQVSTN